MRIALCTDAWHPQVNGVVRSLAATVSRLVERGYAVELITPQQFRTVPCPGYSEIRLALAPRFGTRRALAAFAPDVVHIATEGPIGWSARSWCLAHGVPFTTAFHTRFPDYAAVRTGLSPERFWPLIRRFHAPSRAVMVSTLSLGQELEGRGLPQWRMWSRGIDPAQFHPGHAALPEIAALPGPVQLYVGRSRSRRTCLPSSRPGPAAPRWWSAMAPIWKCCAHAIRKPGSSARWPARNWRGPIARPMSSSSPAAPTPSGW
jgi:glycosyltransferase involved in cell wall biosynthesis